MQEELVSFQVAKLAKEKGFNVGCDHYYASSLTEQIDPDRDTSGSFGWKKGELSLEGHYFINNHAEIDFSSEDWCMCAAPSQSLLQRWLREVHNLHCSVYRMNNKWTSQIYDVNKSSYINPHCYHHGYEEALEWGLREALKLI